MAEFEFSFTVAGLTQLQAGKLMDVIIAVVEALDGEVAGGYVEASDGDDDQGSN